MVDLDESAGPSNERSFSAWNQDELARPLFSDCHSLTLFADEMFDIFPRDGEDVHIRLHGTEADETFGEKLAGSQFEFLRAERGHAFEDVLTFADMSSLIGSDEIGDVEKEGVVAVARSVDESVDRF